jgi:4-alpha-glucanotransferase
MTSIDALRERAAHLGVETSYWDVAGHHHEASAATLQAIVDVLEVDVTSIAGDVAPVVVGQPSRVFVAAARDAELVLADGTALALAVADRHVELPADLPIGCHRISLDDGGVTVVVPPPTMPRAAALDGGASLFVPTYALWEMSSPLPSFGHLGAFATAVHRLGIDVVATLPLYAAFLDEPYEPSPYSPVSRLHWNELYVDDAVLRPDAGGDAHLDGPVGELVDWRTLAVRRRQQLLATAAAMAPGLRDAVDTFVAERPDVGRFARFQAARSAPADAGAPAELVARSHELAQYLAHRQLSEIEGPGRAVLALDLPIGSHPHGYEAWAHGDLFATGMTVGAPPDDFFADGQDWGFPPQLPGAGRRSGHELWRRLVARAGEHASMLRIDHVMGVQRLWWIPLGAGAAEGAYVRYPREELLAVIAAEALRTRTTIVGEDLGTVSDEVRDALGRWDVIGLYEEQFHLAADPLPRPPQRSVAGLRTHDMAAFAAAVAAAGVHTLEGYRPRLEHELGRPVPASAGGLLDGALERLARSDAMMVVADLDDLVGETAPHNVPGMVLDTTWRRRLREPTSAVLDGPDVRRRLELIADRGAKR